MGVDAKIIHDIALTEKDYIIVLYVIDREQFLSQKKE